MTKLLSTTALMVTLAFSGLAYAHEGEHGKDGPDGPPPFMEEALSKLPEKDATLFRDTMKASHEKNEALHDQMHKMHDELHDIISADKFDKDAFIAKSGELAKLHEKMQAGMTKAFATALAKLPADERKTLADSMHEGHMHHHMKKDEGGKPDHDSDDDK